MADEENNEIEATDASDLAAAEGASADEPTDTTAAEESAAQSAGELEAFAEADAIAEHKAQAAAAEAAAEEPAAAEPEAAVEEPAAVEPEAAVEEPAAVEPEAAVEEPAAAEPEAAVEEPAAAEPEAAPAEPQVLLTPKERKVAIKTRKAAKVGTRAEVSDEDRQAERNAARLKKAAERRGSRAHARAKYKASEHERTATPPREHVEGNQKTRQGIVVSDKADKTITVRIDVARRHRKYQKVIRTSNTLHAHDELNDANEGDTVVVRESRPLSRSKRWRLVQIVERAK
jgi:small subunit ribosomal protein S17